MDLVVRTKSYAGNDKSWLGSAHAADTGRPIELDLSTFDFAATFTDNYLPSGLTLGIITATGQYGPYDSAETDGRETAVGHLLEDVAVPDDNETGVALAALFTHGIVVETNLPAADTLDAAAKVDIGTAIRYE